MPGERRQDRRPRYGRVLRQRDGIAKAKADGKYKGRAPTATAPAAESAAGQHLLQSVLAAPKQFFESWGNCGKTYDEAANGTFSRYHIRVRRTARTTSAWGITSLATPHHEDFVWPWHGAGCLHAVDKGGLYDGGGLKSGFSLARELIRSTFQTRGHAVSIRSYGNTIEKRQCDGDPAGSDGQIAFIRI